MKRSELFVKTRKDAPAGEVSKNAQLLIKAGYVHKVMAGVYIYTPLGIRVLEKIKQVVREEMNAIGGQELIMSALQKKSTWDATGRWDDEVVDVWFKTKLKDEDGYLADKDSLGRIQYRDVTEEEAAGRRNYRKADVRNYTDQDKASNVTYNYGSSSLVNDQSRVFKGGSWRDRAYWIDPAQRRYFPQDMATDYIGFRCAVSRVGSKSANAGKRRN